MREKHCFLIRVDASPQMGAGHLMRMLALGQLLSDSGNAVHFVTIPYSPAILNCIEKESFYLHYLTQASTWDQQEDLDSVVSLIVSLNSLAFLKVTIPDKEI